MSNALGITASGAAATNSTTPGSYNTGTHDRYAYPDANTYPVTVGSGGSVTIVSS